MMIIGARLQGHHFYTFDVIFAAEDLKNYKLFFFFFTFLCVIPSILKGW